MRDETLREALHTAAKAEPSAGDPFARFELVRRKSSLARGMVVAGLGVFLLLSFAFVFPNPLNPGADRELPTGGDLEPLPNDVRLYEDSVAGYRLRYPSTWTARGSEGKTIAFFVGNASIGSGAPYKDHFKAPQGFTLEVPRTFYVEVTPRIGSNDPGFIKQGELGLMRNLGSINTVDGVLREQAGQRRLGQVRVVFSPRPVGEGLKRLTYWCESCRVLEVTVVLDPARGVPPLDIRIVAPDQASFEERLFQAIPILDSIERYVVLGD